MMNGDLGGIIRSVGNENLSNSCNSFHHTPHQIKQLEEFFKNCSTHPNANERQELSTELGLTSNQIMFWFQNRRTQSKTMKQRVTSETLKLENEKIEKENLALNEFLSNPFCPDCDASHSQSDIQKIRTENLELKQELERQSMSLLMKSGTFGTLLNFSPKPYDNSPTAYPIYAQRDEQTLMTNSPDYANEAGGMTPQGRANLMSTAQRMMKDFWDTLRKCQKLDIHHPIRMQNDDIRVSVRPSDASGGLVVSASSSLWLNVSRSAIFDYLNDEKSRVQWNIFTDSSSIKTSVNFSYGSYPGNGVLIFQPSSLSDSNGTIIQGSYSDPLGSAIVYAPIPFPWLKSVISGEGSILTVLPVGFIISDGIHSAADVASSSSSSEMLGGSLLTMVFQMLAESEDNMKAITDNNHIITSTMLTIKSALCGEA